MPTINLTYKQHQEFVVTIPVYVDVDNDEYIDLIVEDLDDSDDWYTKVVMPTFKKEITAAFDEPYSGYVERVQHFPDGCYELYADPIEKINEFLDYDYTKEFIKMQKVDELECAMERHDYATVARLAAELNAGIYE